MSKTNLKDIYDPDDTGEFYWDPHCTGRARITHRLTGRAVIEQPWMRDADWETEVKKFVQEMGGKPLDIQADIS